MFRIASRPGESSFANTPSFRPLLGALRVAVVVVVLALRLLVAEQVAPPAAGVVHLIGRAGAVGLPHFLRGKTNG